MPYIVVGLALYLLWRYFGKAAASGTPAVPGSGDGGGSDNGLPASYQGDGGGGGGPPPPAPAPTSWQWTALGAGEQITPGFTYRASAPPQDSLTMMMLPNGLSGYGFVNVAIYKPGDAFPNDWPDTGSGKLRIEATLPTGAAAQDPSQLPSGTTVWRRVPQESVGALIGRIVDHARRRVGGVPIAYPQRSGVYDGLVRRRR